MVTRLFAIFASSLMAIAIVAFPATAAKTEQPLTQQELESLLEMAGFGFNSDYDGDLPTRSEVQVAIAQAMAIQAQIESMDIPSAYEEAHEEAEYSNAIEYHRVCSAYTPGLTGRVRFQFWLESDGSIFTDINDFEAEFLPAPTLPNIGGVDMESIEGTITNKYNYPSANGQKWVGAANVTIILTYLEYFEWTIYAHVLCSVRHP